MNAVKTILIIEDHDESRFLYSEILKSENYQVVETEHGRAALEYLKQNPAPDLIVMDLTFPYGTPKEFVDGLRAKSELQKVPLLVISGQYDIREQSDELGACGFIKKPFDMDPFLATIQKLTH